VRYTDVCTNVLDASPIGLIYCIVVVVVVYVLVCLECRG